MELSDYDAQIAKKQQELDALVAARAQVTKQRDTIYLHRNNDEYFDWEIDDDGKQRFSNDVHGKIHYALYEVEFDVEFDLTTGEYVILEVRDGRNVLRPVCAAKQRVLENDVPTTIECIAHDNDARYVHGDGYGNRWNDVAK